MVGNEGLLGISLIMGGERMPSGSVVQSAGYAYRLPRLRVKEEFNRHDRRLHYLPQRSVIVSPDSIPSVALATTQVVNCRT